MTSSWRYRVLVHAIQGVCISPPNDFQLFFFIFGMVYMISNHNKIGDALSLQSFISMINSSIRIVLHCYTVRNHITVTKRDGFLRMCPAPKVQYMFGLWRFSETPIYVKDNSRSDSVASYVLSFQFAQKWKLKRVFYRNSPLLAVAKVCRDLQKYQITNQKAKTWPKDLIPTPM